MSRFIKKSIVLLVAIVAFYIQIVPVFAQTTKENVYLGGMPAGFVMQMKSVEVVGFSDFVTDSGIKSPAKECGIKTGDKILRFGNKTIASAVDLDNVCQNCHGEAEIIELERNGEQLKLKIRPIKELSSGVFRIGVLVRDSISGVGTVTFIKEDGGFAALGHPVYEKDHNLLEISGGNCFQCGVVGVNRGERGAPGELKGAFLSSQSIAEIKANTPCGILGEWKGDTASRPKIEVGKISIVKMGKGSMFSTVDGCNPQEYQISIIKVDKDNKENKNFVIKITDKTLLNSTGGIVQGMSGSPIVQNGKLVGAITHVFVNDPTRGYGISIEKMLNAA